MQPHPKFKKTILCALMGFVAGAPATQAVALDFAQSPAGQVNYTPAPNVIITIDDSYSMTQGLSGPTSVITDTNPAKIDLLKSTLTDIFSDTGLLPDGKIRLAWQAMWNPDALALGAGQVNSMKVLDSTHRANFLSFVDSLGRDQSKMKSTPSHKMMRQAFDYMNTGRKGGNDVNSPWAGTPGVDREPLLACRRAYHIFLTDGKSSNVYDPETGKYPLVRKDLWLMQPNENDPTIDDDFKTDGATGLNAKTHSNYRRILPDGTSYEPSTNETKVFYDSASSDGIPLADWAFQSWATNLSGLENGVVPTDEYVNAPNSESFVSKAIPKYWNPKYDPATWQHLVTYTIGYGVEATSWSDAKYVVPTQTVPYGWDGSFPNFMTATPMWPRIQLEDPNSTLDLWHAAINGRGRFYAVKQTEDLRAAFQSILQKINDESSNGVAGISASSSANVYDKVGLFTAGYDSTKGWAGYVSADQYDTDGAIASSTAWGATGGTGLGGQQTTADKLDALSAAQINARVIFTTQDVSGLGVPFQWATGTTNLSAAQKAQLGPNATQQQNVLNFLRGDRSKETSATPAGTLRPRQSRQGDIVNSGVWYVGAPASGYNRSGYQTFRKSNANRAAMLYVGGNDGMLHGFSAATGDEKVAYVPMGLMGRLARLAEPGYSHTYYVDNTPFSGDVNLNEGQTAPDWKTLLVGTLGAGGRGYFVLDITDPGAFVNANASKVVVLDKTLPGTSDDSDIGYIFAPPVLDDANPFVTTQITRMNDGRWAVILGNGYNSVAQKPVLLIQYLDGAQELFKLTATSPATAYYYDGSPKPNGLSAPRVVDLNGDGTADVVYAGDLQGNMWKFDVTSANPDDWEVAFDGAPLYTAVRGAGNNAKAQPIFAPPTVKPNDRGAGGMMVAFGTGASLTVADRGNTNTQTIYSVLDNTRYEPDAASSGKLKTIKTAKGAVPAPAAVGSGVAKLQQQSIGASSSGAEGQSFWNVNAVSIDWTTQKGWYLNLPARGERLLKPMPFYDGSNILAVFSQVPDNGSVLGAEESCTGGAVTAGQQYLTLLNIMDGKPPSVSVLDRNGDGMYNAADGYVARTTLAAGATRMVSNRRHTKVFAGGVKDKAGKPSTGLEMGNMPETPVRPSWRQM